MTTLKIYKLINPTLVGTFVSTFKAETPLKAAKIFWNMFTKTIMNNIPQLCFTLKDDTNKLYNFVVNEQINEDGNSEFTIKEINIKLTSDEEKIMILKDKNLKKNLKNKEDVETHTQADGISITAATTGGSHKLRKNKEKEELSPEAEKSLKNLKKHLKKNRAPILYYHYIPTIYPVESLYIPVFTQPYCTPMIALDLMKIII